MMLFSLRLSPLYCPLSQEKPRLSGVFFLDAGSKPPANSSLVTPTLGETEAVFSRPVRVDPGNMFVLIRVPKRPLVITGAVVELRPFVGDIVDEDVKLPPAFVCDQAEAGIGKRIRVIDERRIAFGPTAYKVFRGSILQYVLRFTMVRIIASEHHLATPDELHRPPITGP